MPVVYVFIHTWINKHTNRGLRGNRGDSNRGLRLCRCRKVWVQVCLLPVRRHGERQRWNKFLLMWCCHFRYTCIFLTKKADCNLGRIKENICLFLEVFSEDILCLFFNLRTDSRDKQEKENWMNNTVRKPLYAARASMYLLFDLDSAINSANTHEEKRLKKAVTFIRW